MKTFLFQILFLFINFSSFAQDLVVINPQLNKNIIYRDIENIIYLPNIDQKKYVITSTPNCKIEKIKYTDDFGMSYTCFKVSQVPDVKSILISIQGQGKSYGTIKYNVLPNAPKK